MSDEKKKMVGKKKINKYSKADCETELARLAETKSENSVYGDDVRRQLLGLTHRCGN